MPNPLLQTKLYIPPTRPRLVPRPLFMNKLNSGLNGEATGFPRKLTLISAPAGFGKTTLIAQSVDRNRSVSTPSCGTGRAYWTAIY